MTNQNLSDLLGYINSKARYVLVSDTHTSYCERVCDASAQYATLLTITSKSGQKGRKRQEYRERAISKKDG